MVGIGPTTRQDQTVYDSTCGSGSLLLKAAAEAPRGLTIYGQEKDYATWALAKMNIAYFITGIDDVLVASTGTDPRPPRRGRRTPPP